MTEDEMLGGIGGRRRGEMAEDLPSEGDEAGWMR